MSISAVYNTMSGMQLDQRRHRVIAENLAAADIPGFKASHVFGEQYKNEADKDNISGVGGGASRVDFSQGVIKQTGRALDFAVSGKGFFQVRSFDNRPMLTRNGAFMVNTDRELITSQGFKVEAEEGTLQLLPGDDLNKIEVSPEGVVKVRSGGNSRVVGRLKIVQLENTDDLERLTGSYYSLQAGKQARPFKEEQRFSVVNGAVEESNVNPIMTMASMIDASRSFQTGQRVLKMLEQRYQSEVTSFTR